MDLLVTGAASLLETIVAVHGAGAGRLKRHLGVGTAVRAYDGIHLPGPSTSTSTFTSAVASSSPSAAPLGPSRLPARGTPFRVCISFFHMVALIVGAEHKCVTALGAHQRPVLKDHLRPPFFLSDLIGRDHESPSLPSIAAATLAYGKVTRNKSGLRTASNSNPKQRFCRTGVGAFKGARKPRRQLDRQLRFRYDDSVRHDREALPAALERAAELPARPPRGRAACDVVRPIRWAANRRVNAV